MIAPAPYPAKCRQVAFTLLELLVVMGLIAILSGLVIGAGRYAMNSGQTARARAELAVLAAALESYRLMQGDYPRTDDPAILLQALLGRMGPDNQARNTRPHLDIAKFVTADARDPFTDSTAVLIDPWELPYRYAYKSQTPWSNPAYVLFSAGPDRSASTGMLAGGYPDLSATGNVDNLYSDFQL